MREENQEIVGLLDEIAHLIDETGGNRYKARAYDRAASSLRDAHESIRELYDDRGESAIMEISGIGEGIARVVAEYLESGRSRVRDDLRAQARPRSVIAEIPGIGDELSNRIVSELGVHSLAELEEAAHDGRLADVEGLGDERVQAVQDHLAQRLQRSSTKRTDTGASGEEPPEKLLLELDREYREKAKAGELRTIAPRRFNPDHKRWLPVMETTRDGWEFSVLYSNTARAHEEGTTHDWVVIYFERGGRKGQHTVVTAERGPHKGDRIVAR